MSHESTSASHTGHALPQRKVSFDFSNTPLHWLPGDAFTSHFINEIHMILPAGEFWFCRVYKEALPEVTDPQLRDDVKGFIRQEAVHGRAHSEAIKNFLDAHGMETRSYLRGVEWLFGRLLDSKPLGISLPGPLARLWLRFRLGIIASIEHFTCILGKYVIEQRYFDQGDPVMVDMLRWHGAEEIEHRSVAFDLYQHLGGGYVARWLMFALVAPILLWFWVAGAAHLMRQDPALAPHRPAIWRPWFWQEWSRIAERGHMPSLRWLLAETLRYLRRDYHPVNEASTEMALAYLDRSPAVQAAMKSAA
ncbi:MAG: metal-dependent hydrolase [Moraxellaceae bacterium]